MNNSEKGATTISNNDYYIVTGFYADCLEKSAAYGIIHLEVREAGKTFINKIDIEASTNDSGDHRFTPYLIVPNAAGKDFSGGFEGVLASVV